MSKIYWCWKNLPGSLRRIWQNLTRGWNDSDIWNLDHTIAIFVIPRLKKLKEKTNGYPGSLEINESDYEEGMIQWKQILDKMIYAFEGIAFRLDKIEIKSAGGKLEIVNDKSSDKYSTLEYVGTKEQKELHEQYMNKYKKDSEEEQKKIEEGLQLFTKHFQSLWD